MLPYGATTPHLSYTPHIHKHITHTHTERDDAAVTVPLDSPDGRQGSDAVGVSERYFSEKKILRGLLGLSALSGELLAELRVNAKLHGSGGRL